MLYEVITVLFAHHYSLCILLVFHGIGNHRLSCVRKFTYIEIAGDLCALFRHQGWERWHGGGPAHGFLHRLVKLGVSGTTIKGNADQFAPAVDGDHSYNFV